MVTIIVAAALAGAAQSPKHDEGMFLCPSPIIATGFFNSLETAKDTGVPLTFEIDNRIAVKNDCRFVASRHLVPIDFVAGELAITDGHIKGWASPYLYIIYVNDPRHLAREGS